MKTKNFKFKSMALVLFALVLSSNVWGEEWTQVTSVAAGDEVVIAVIDDGTQELTSISTTSTKYGIGAEFTTNPAGTMIWTVEKGSSDGTFAFKNGSNYLRWNSGNSVDAAGTAVEGKTSWTITTSNSRAKVANVNTNSRILMWNKSSTRFACYENKTHGNNSGSYYYYVIFYKKAAPKTISSIAVTTSPKTNYTTCEKLVVSDWEVTATYSDASTDDVTSGCTFSPANGSALTAGSQTVTVTHTASGKTTTKTVTVTQGAKDTFVDHVQETADQYGECNYTIPSCGDKTKGAGCEGEHYKFIGWSSTQIQAGTQPTEPAGLLKAGASHNATGATYYAVWAKEDE